MQRGQIAQVVEEVDVELVEVRVRVSVGHKGQGPGRGFGLGVGEGRVKGQGSARQIACGSAELPACVQEALPGPVGDLGEEGLRKALVPREGRRQRCACLQRRRQRLDRPPAGLFVRPPKVP